MCVKLISDVFCLKTTLCDMQFTTSNTYLLSLPSRLRYSNYVSCKYNFLLRHFSTCKTDFLNWYN